MFLRLCYFIGLLIMNSLIQSNFCTLIIWAKLLQIEDSLHEMIQIVYLNENLCVSKDFRIVQFLLCLRGSWRLCMFFIAYIITFIMECFRKNINMCIVIWNVIDVFENHIFIVIDCSVMFIFLIHIPIWSIILTLYSISEQYCNALLQYLHFNW